MTQPHLHDAEQHDAEQHDAEQHTGHHGGHGWMMIACCIPMLAIAVVLVAAGVVSAGFLLVAVGCTVMMALMMRSMSGMSHDGPQDR